MINDITGDKLITGSATDAYRTGWDRIFGNKRVEPEVTEVAEEDFSKAFFLEIEEHDNWSGRKRGGYFAFKSEAAAREFIKDAYSDRDGPVLGYYETYDIIGWLRLDAYRSVQLKNSRRPYIYMYALV